jgi:hypothetical protein
MNIRYDENYHANDFLTLLFPQNVHSQKPATPKNGVNGLRVLKTVIAIFNTENECKLDLLTPGK